MPLMPAQKSWSVRRLPPAVDQNGALGPLAFVIVRKSGRGRRRAQEQIIVVKEVRPGQTHLFPLIV